MFTYGILKFDLFNIHKEILRDTLHGCNRAAGTIK